MPPLAAPKIWPAVAPILQRALDRDNGEETTEDILGKVLDTTNALWVVYHGKELAAVAITAITTYPRFRAAKLGYLAGDGLDLWFKPLMADIEAWARECRCVALEGIGRPGWKPHLKAIGIKQTGYVYRKELAP